MSHDKYVGVYELTLLPKSRNQRHNKLYVSHIIGAADLWGVTAFKARHSSPKYIQKVFMIHNVIWTSGGFTIKLPTAE